GLGPVAKQHGGQGGTAGGQQAYEQQRQQSGVTVQRAQALGGETRQQQATGDEDQVHQGQAQGQLPAAAHEQIGRHVAHQRRQPAARRRQARIEDEQPQQHGVGRPDGGQKPHRPGGDPQPGGAHDQQCQAQQA